MSEAPSVKDAVRAMVQADQDDQCAHVEVCIGIDQWAAADRVVMNHSQVHDAMDAFREAHGKPWIEAERKQQGMRRWQVACAQMREVAAKWQVS